MNRLGVSAPTPNKWWWVSPSLKIWYEALMNKKNSPSNELEWVKDDLGTYSGGCVFTLADKWAKWNIGFLRQILPWKSRSVNHQNNRGVELSSIQSQGWHTHTRTDTQMQPWTIPHIANHGANMGPTWVLSVQMGPMLAPWTLLLGTQRSILALVKYQVFFF